MESKDRICRKGCDYIFMFPDVSRLIIHNSNLEYFFSLNYYLFLPSSPGKRYENVESRNSVLIFGTFYLLVYLFDFQTPH